MVRSLRRLRVIRLVFGALGLLAGYIVWSLLLSRFQSSVPADMLSELRANENFISLISVSATAFILGSCILLAHTGQLLYGVLDRNRPSVDAR
jgi:hypothetical protein